MLLNKAATSEALAKHVASLIEEETGNADWRLSAFCQEERLFHRTVRPSVDQMMAEAIAAINAQLTQNPDDEVIRLAASYWHRLGASPLIVLGEGLVRIYLLAELTFRGKPDREFVVTEVRNSEVFTKVISAMGDSAVFGNMFFRAVALTREEAWGMRNA